MDGLWLPMCSALCSTHTHSRFISQECLNFWILIKAKPELPNAKEPPTFSLPSSPSPLCTALASASQPSVAGKDFLQPPAALCCWRSAHFPAGANIPIRIAEVIRSPPDQPEVAGTCAHTAKS